MLIFSFELDADSGTGEISGFAEGHMRVLGANGSLSSKKRQPDQTMMIFVSIVDLLDGIRRFLLDSASSEYQFIGCDSSFMFTIEKQTSKSLLLLAGALIIDRVGIEQLVNAIWVGLAPFLEANLKRLKPDDVVTDDLNAAIEEFRRIFDYL